VVLVVHFHVSLADEWAYRRLIPKGGKLFRRIRELEQAVLLAVDGIVHVSQSSPELLRSRVPLLDEVPAAFIPNFIRDSTLTRDQRLGPAADLVTIGSLERAKNHEFMLEVLAEAAKLGRRCTLDLIGEGSRRSALVRKADALGVLQDVRFLGRRPDARGLLPGHKVYVHTANREVLPVAILEAMAAGLPILAAPAGGISYMLEDGRAGTLWSLDDPAAAAQVLIDMLADTAKLAATARAARARYVETFSASRVGPILLGFLSSLSTGVRPATPLALAHARAGASDEEA
jgi:glycosyltransferase involved in cell wall biosynthesis